MKTGKNLVVFNHFTNKTMIEQARKLYDQAQADYPKLKAQIEAQVVRWFWASGGVGLFSLEPFYFEQNHFSKSRILKDAPEDTDNKYQYGVNEKDEIIVERSYMSLKVYMMRSSIFVKKNKLLVITLILLLRKNV